MLHKYEAFDLLYLDFISVWAIILKRSVSTSQSEKHETPWSTQNRIPLVYGCFFTLATCFIFYISRVVRPTKTSLILDLRHKHNILRHIDLVLLLLARKFSWCIVTTILMASGLSNVLWLVHYTVFVITIGCNRPFPSYLVPLFQNRSSLVQKWV